GGMGARGVHPRPRGPGLGAAGGGRGRRGPRAVAGRVRGGRLHGRSPLPAPRRTPARAGRRAGRGGYPGIVSRTRPASRPRRRGIVAWLLLLSLALAPAAHAEQAEGVVLTSDTGRAPLPPGSDPASLRLVAERAVVEAGDALWALD